MLARCGAALRLVRAEAELPQPRNDLGCALFPGRGFGLTRGGFRSRLLALLHHERRAECDFGGVLVVRPAAEPDAGHRGLTSAGNRVQVVELEPAARRAALP